VILIFAILSFFSFSGAKGRARARPPPFSCASGYE